MPASFQSGSLHWVGGVHPRTDLRIRTRIGPDADFIQHPFHELAVSWLPVSDRHWTYLEEICLQRVVRTLPRRNKLSVTVAAKSGDGSNLPRHCHMMPLPVSDHTGGQAVGCSTVIRQNVIPVPA